MGYDTKNNGEAVLSRRRRLLSTIWMKSVLVASAGFEFLISFEFPKIPDLAKYVEKVPKIVFFFYINILHDTNLYKLS